MILTCVLRETHHLPIKGSKLDGVLETKEIDMPITDYCLSVIQWPKIVL